MATTHSVLEVTPGSPSAWADASASYPALTTGKISAGVVPDLSSVYAALSAGKIPAGLMPTQAAIPNLSLGALTLLTDVITALGTVQASYNTALGTVQASYNTLLSELRTAGIITP